MKSLSRKLAAGLAAAGLIVGATGVAVADNLVADGDVATAAENVSFGNVCKNASATKTVKLAIARHGAAGSTNVFKNASSPQVTWAGLSWNSTYVSDVSSAPLHAHNVRITLPENWSTLPNNTLSNVVNGSLTINTGSTPGATGGTASWRAIGVNSSNESIFREDTINWSATVVDCTPADSTPPAIGYTLSPSAPDGDNGWYTSNVDLTWTVTENQSPASLVKTGCVDQSITQDQAATTYSCSATSDGGRTPAVNVTVKRDGTGPTVACNPAVAPTGWQASNPVFSCTSSDAPAGLLNASDAAFQLTTTVADGSEDADASTASKTVADKAGNQTTQPAFTGIKVDRKDPTDIEFTGTITDGASYYWGGVPNDAGCTAEDSGSGFKECRVSGYSAAVGAHTLTATATDKVGNSGTSTITYEVKPWTAKGFYQPVDMANTLNTVKGGSTVPLKFEVFALNELTDTAVMDAFTVKEIPCGSVGTAGTDDIEQYSTGGTSLRYDATGGQFIQNWQTPKTINKCYRVDLKLDDGTSLPPAYFKTK